MEEEGKSGVLLSPRLYSLCFVMPLFFISVISTGRGLLSQQPLFHGYILILVLIHGRYNELRKFVTFGPILSLCQVAVKWLSSGLKQVDFHFHDACP
jgi:hypothetical protein